MRRSPAALLSGALLTGCAGPAAGDGCAWVRPILYDPDDVLTASTQDRIDAHNTAWDERCARRG